MTKVIITKSTIAKKKRALAGMVLDLDPAEASFLVRIQKAKYFDGDLSADFQTVVSSESTSSVPKRKRGRPAKT